MSNVFYKLQLLIKKNISDLILLLVIILVVLLIIFSSIFYRKSKIRRYNTQLLEILEITDNQERVRKIEEGYNSKGIPEISKTMFSIRLSREYYRMGNNTKFIEVNENILKTEKDEVLRSIAILNILHIKLNEQKLDVEYLEKLFKKAEHKKNPFLNIIMEKKAVFYLRRGEKEMAENIINTLLQNEFYDDNSRSRIEKYKYVLGEEM
jgi:predicted negative regulator of RcsB-dependent stress response